MDSASPFEVSAQAFQLTFPNLGLAATLV